MVNLDWSKTKWTRDGPLEQGIQFTDRKKPRLNLFKRKGQSFPLIKTINKIHPKDEKHYQSRKSTIISILGNGSWDKIKIPSLHI